MSQMIKEVCRVVLVFACVCFCSMKSYAAQATLDQLEYTENNGVVTVEGYNGGSANVDLGALFPDATEIIIENWAFYTSHITGITMPQTVTSIGDLAFYESNITSITIPKNVSSIGECAFSGCTNLQTVTFEERTTETITFGERTFQGCYNLLELKLPSTVTSIPEYFCYDCTALTSVELSETCRIIGDGAFENCKLVNITIPEACTSIGEMVFSGCTDLQAVIFENPNTRIGEVAFPSSEEAKNLVIYCDEIGSVTVYATTYNIQYTIAMLSLTITQAPAKTEYFYGERSELDISGMKLSAEYTEGEGTRKEEVKPADCTFSAFDSSKVGEQIITVSYSGRETTFTVNVYYNLADVSVEVDAATYTGSRIEPYLNVTNSGAGNVLIKNKDYAVLYSDNVNVGTATAKISGMGAYKGEKTVEFQILPRTITDANTSVVVADMEYTGQQLKPVPVVSYGTETLTFDKDYIVKYGANVEVGKGYVLVEGKGNYTGSVKKEFNINVVTVSDEKNNSANTEEKATPKKGNTYTRNSMIYKVTSSSTVTFTKPVDKNVKKLSIPSKVKILGKTFKVTKINKKACYNCKKLTTVTIGNYVTTIGDQAFAECGKLKKVTIGKGLKKIGKKAFYKDKKLKTLIIRSMKLTSVGKGTLRGVKKVDIKAARKKLSEYKKLFKEAK